MRLLNFSGFHIRWRSVDIATRVLIWIAIATTCIRLTTAQELSSTPAVSSRKQHDVENPRSLMRNAIQVLQRSTPIHMNQDGPDHSQCADVHKAQDQCAWIIENCEDQDSGLLSYLELYYCKLPQAKSVAMIIMLFWLLMLFSTIGITASDYFCVNLSTISMFLGLSESVTGVTLLAFGNGSPDVFSTWAAMSTNSGSLAIGELIGAASFITAIVAGSMAIVRPFKVARKSFVRDLGFFIVATAFSLGFLVDGHLQLWECIIMVVFYVFYVIVVILWHWRSKKRKAKKARDLLAREHFLPPEYTDRPNEADDDEDGIMGTTRGRQPEDEFSILERSEQRDFDEDNEDDDTRDRYMAEITTNMRVSRPRGISRENSRNPIRPSLIGALEFRAAVASLERSRSALSIPLHRRRNSDDAVTNLGQQQRLHRADSDLDPIAIPPPDFRDQGPYRDEPMSARPRAVSTNALDMRTPGHAPSDARLPITGGVTNELQAGLPRLLIPVDDFGDNTTGNHVSNSPALLTPASAERPSGLLSPVSRTDSDPGIVIPDMTGSLLVPGTATRTPHQDDATSSQYFVAYHDVPRKRSRSRTSSLLLPPPILPEDGDIQPQRKLRWWPYGILPPPEELFSTLFPTLCSWSTKSHLGRFLGILTAPSVFLLNITLPVVESSPSDEKDIIDGKKSRKHSVSSNNLLDMSNSHPQTPRILTEDEHGQARPPAIPPSDSQSLPLSQEPRTGWNRWLLCIQLLLAPVFIVLVVWLNIDDDHDTQSLLLYLGIGLILSLVSLLVVLMTTNEQTPPRYRQIFCILGFAVSVSWISTIANEVVGILKALGIILNISEAILGLTVFAVGSSLGDLVADITIARLGYPMMALSACFGGPMLNILLGIGLSGIYLLLQRGEKYHHKHPDRPIRYKAYHIEIDRTLVVSSVALLVTLIGLAIAVPLNGWRMSRRIGWALIGIWVIATALNLGIEIGGLTRSTELLGF